VTNLLELVEDQLGVPVLIERFEANDIAGVLLLHAAGDSFVAINADHHPVRQRFTLAHELGHLHLGHQPRIELVSDVFGSATDPQEAEANYFAAEFLAPRHGLTTWLEERAEIGAVGLEAVARIALEFGIAYTTACYRLERAGVITAAEKRRLVTELRSSGGEYARRFSAVRLNDSIEGLWRSKDYPRVPRQTATYAERARDEGLIDDATHDTIMRGASETQDISSWFT
jgi:Zn-dependent peptidase ImmA (M78 family)